MATKKRGLVDRILMGREKSEGYARASLPSNRWELFFDILKGRFFKLVGLNLLTMVFFIPLFLLLFFRYASLLGYGEIVPFSQCFGIGYMAPTSLIGFNESLNLSVDTFTLMFLPVCGIIASIGLSGCAYCMRNLVWTEGTYVTSDFWHGIKLNFKQICLSSIIYTVLLYAMIIVIDMINFLQVQGQMVDWLAVVFKILEITFIFIFTICYMFSLTNVVTYELPFFKMLANTFLFSIGLMLQNVIMVLLCLIPVVFFFLGNFFFFIGIFFVLLFGISYVMLIWTDYSQWAFDKFINDRVKGAIKNRGIYEKISERDATNKALEQHIAINSTLVSRPIKPITDEEYSLKELPMNFNRKDIEELNASKELIKKAGEDYEKEHINDERYVMYKKMQEENSEKSNETYKENQKRMEKIKKELEKHNKIKNK